MSKVVCPYCFEPFASSDVMFRCSNQKCEKKEDEILSGFWQKGVKKKENEKNYEYLETPCFRGRKRFFGGSPESAKCPKCGNLSFWVICPHCHNRIPKQMVKTKGYIISIIGALNSGKTNYITTLINELMQRTYCLGNIGVVASNVANRPENNTQARYERDFFNWVYKQGKCPQKTVKDDPRNRIPLIYEISQKGKPSLYLVIYDTAGENFINPLNIAAKVDYLKQSDACIYLLDTFAIPYVHGKLKGKLRLPDIEVKFDKIIDNVIGYFEEGDPKIKKEQYKKPLALVFSKIDSILLNEELFRDTSIEGMSIGHNSSFLDGSGVNLADMESVSEGVRGALHYWGEDNFINNIENHYKKVHYFGISALGGIPDKNGNINNLRPYRVLDPLVWILHEFKYSLPIAK